MSDDTALSKTEQTRLAKLEMIISSGIRSFTAVGEALLEIRDKRLYRPLLTFDEYCQLRWQMSKSHANRNIDASRVAKILEPNDISVLTESHARPLAPFLDNPGEVLAIYDEAAASAPEGRVTAKLIKEVADAHRVTTARNSSPAHSGQSGEVIDGEVIEDSGSDLDEAPASFRSWLDLAIELINETNPETLKAPEWRRLEKLEVAIKELRSHHKK